MTAPDRRRDDDTVVLVPIRTRAHRVVPVAESIRASCQARILFVASPDDTAVLTVLGQMGSHLAAEYMTVPYYPRGDYARKVNAGIRATHEPLIFMGADDLCFHDGWLDAARAALAPGVGLVGTNDLCNPRVVAGEHSTHSLITRAYIQQHGTIDGPGQALYEGYPHEWVDDELVGTAKHRRAYAHADKAHVQHQHPNCGGAPVDDFYRGQQRRMAAGRRIFEQRRRRWT